MDSVSQLDLKNMHFQLKYKIISALDLTKSKFPHDHVLSTQVSAFDLTKSKFSHDIKHSQLKYFPKRIIL